MTPENLAERARVEAGEVHAPVVNVAESWAKLVWESPYIAEAVMRSVERSILDVQDAGVQLAVDEKGQRTATVLGYGAIGEAIAKNLLARGYEVHVFDTDAAKLAKLPPGIVGHADKRDALSFARVLISGVGTQTLTAEDHELVPDGAVLINAASGDEELGVHEQRSHEKPTCIDNDQHLWALFRGKPVNLGFAPDKDHSHMVVKTAGGKELLFANSGTVINHTGERNPIPSRYIQLTIGLLFLGAVAARRGMREIPKEWQEALVNLVQRSLRETGEDLARPTFDPSGPRRAPRTPPPTVFDLEKTSPVAATPVGKIIEEVGPALRAQPSLPPNNGKDVVYGYRLGATLPDSKERVIANLVEKSRTLSVEGAATHRAVFEVNAAFGAHFVAGLHNESGASRFGSDTDHHGPRSYTDAAEQTPTRRFEQVFGNTLRVLVESRLTRIKKRAPTPEEIASDIRVVAARTKVDLEPWKSALSSSADAADRALFLALTA
jgi:hypothetical protein